MPASVSSLGPATAVEGLLLYMGTSSGSPASMEVIANATDLTIPIMTDTVDVTNVGDSWKRHFPTLHDMGKIAFKIFWMMTDPTHDNAATGLRYVMINSVLRDFAFVYPDGNNSTDSFAAYVTSFSITGKVGGVFEASIELSNSGAPSLV